MFTKLVNGVSSIAKIAPPKSISSNAEMMRSFLILRFSLGMKRLKIRNQKNQQRNCPMVMMISPKTNSMKILMVDMAKADA